MRRIGFSLLLCGSLLASTSQMFCADAGRWSEAKANSWYGQQTWPVGSNFTPIDAINQLEMWQAATFDPQEIDKELGWGEGLGMTTMRVFLHDLLWQQDEAGFKERINIFLTIADKHHIKPVFVIFDSCWDPDPKLGPQHPPIPGVHNSGWVQSPGEKALRDKSQYGRLETYVKGVVGAFASDKRILAWDLWNEPDNGNDRSYGKNDPENKNALVAVLLPQVFAWARSAHPTQPLTSGVWHDDNWSSPGKLNPVERVQLTESDVISFHNYGPPEQFAMRIKQLEPYHRPILCTEYMARPAGSTFDGTLPIAKNHNVGAINWGFAKGKTQTWLPWDSWQRPYVLIQPVVWFHDIFYADGKPYREREVDIIRYETGKVTTGPAADAAAAEIHGKE